MEFSETVVKILESVLHAHTQIVNSLVRLEEHQQQSTQTLAQILDLMDARMLEIQRRTEAIDGRIAADTRALAEILKHVADTTSRTEQMTARILTELSVRGPSH